MKNWKIQGEIKGFHIAIFRGDFSMTCDIMALSARIAEKERNKAMTAEILNETKEEIGAHERVVLGKRTRYMLFLGRDGDCPLGWGARPPEPASRPPLLEGHGTSTGLEGHPLTAGALLR